MAELGGQPEVQARLLNVLGTVQLNLGEYDQAEPLLRDALKRGWNETLVEIYGQLDTGHPTRQLDVAEKLLKERPQHPVLLLALGRLCLRAKLWGKARGYLEAAIGAGGSG